MSLYIKAVLNDYMRGKVDHITSIDIAQAVDSLVKRGVLTKQHVLCLRDYLLGYEPNELEYRYTNWYELLVEGYAAIAEESGITDESFINIYIHQYPKYKKIRSALIGKMEELGRQFNDLDT